MNAYLKYIAVILLFTAGCETRKKQEDYEKKVLAINQKEQELLFKEKTLELKEAELRQREAKLDSIKNVDTVNKYNPVLTGTWGVKMTCSETTCVGSAVGDTKNETWYISYQQNAVLARAMAGNTLVRVYSGRSTGTALELTESNDSTLTKAGTKIVVRLNLVNENAMEGQREIFRDQDCKVTYQLELVRKQS